VASRKTVLHLIDTGGPGGAETIFFNLVSGLDPDRWRSVAVVPVKDWLWGELEAHGVEPIHLPSQGSFDLTYLRGIARLARATRASLIQTHLFSSAVYASAAARLLRVPVVATFHGQTDVTTGESFYSTKMRILRRRRNAYVFVSRKLMQNYVGVGLIDAQRARVIYNGIDCGSSHGRVFSGLDGLLGGQDGDFLIGAVGNLRRPKDYQTFVRAAARLAQASPRYRFVIVGAADEPIRSELLALVGELGLGNRFRLAGFKSDIARVMNALDCYALSSTSEGFSLTTVQAMACGIVPVATRCGGPEEIVSDNVNGLLVPVRDPEALAEAIERVANDESLRSRLARQAYAHVRASYSVEKMITGYAALYDEFLTATTRVHAER